jgi:hypothetical protein
MTLVEAIKSGKRFQRKGSTGYYEPKLLPNTFFVVDEIMADDWEVEPTPITITREQFEATWYRARTRAADWDKVYKILVEELGL